ncbi:MAG: Mut7-C RNAse domain-containing protein [Gammaproteobacteria bacterium]
MPLPPLPSGSTATQRRPRFVVDANLGKLADYLRMCGFDTLYRSDYRDPEIAAISTSQQRILLSRDRQLLKRRQLTHAYYVRATNPRRQLLEVLARFDLARSMRPFSRCLRCNDPIEAVPKSALTKELQPRTRRYYQQFWRCHHCLRIYWKGTHYLHMLRFLREVRQRLAQGE